MLGPLEVAADGVSLPLGGAKQRALLALLLLSVNEVVSVDRLVDDLWGEAPPESATNMVHGYVSHLRRLLEPGRGRGEHALLVSRPGGYLLQLRPQQLDAERFAALAADGRRLLESGRPDDAAERLADALGVWRGPALADLAYEPFAQREAARLEELRLAAVEDRIDAELACGRHERVVADARDLVAAHPLRERLRGQLMAALYRSGRQAEALAVYDDARRTLTADLGIEPGPTLRELQRAILNHDPALGSPPPPPAAARRRVDRRFVAAAIAVIAGGALAAALSIGRSSGAGRVAVANDSVAVIDPRQNVVVDDIAVGDYPGPLAADASFVYVANIGDATVTRIAALSRKRWDTTSFSRAIDLAAVNGHLWAANGGSPGHTPPGTPLGSVLDYAPGPVWHTYRIGPNIGGTEEQTTVATDGAGYAVWIANQDTALVRQLDASTGRTLLTIRGPAPGGLAAVGDSSSGDTVWAADPKRNVVFRIDERARRIVRRISIPDQPTRIAANEEAVWVVTRGSRHAVWRIDPRSNRVLARIPLPLTPSRIALGSGAVWISGYDQTRSGRSSTNARVVRIDPSTNRIVAIVPLGARAADAILVSHHLVWVTVPTPQ